MMVERPQSADDWRAIADSVLSQIEAARVEGAAYLEEANAKMTLLQDELTSSAMIDLLLFAGSAALRISALIDEFGRIASVLRRWSAEDALETSYALDNERVNNSKVMALQNRSWEERESVYKMNQLAFVRRRDVAKLCVERIGDELEQMNNVLRSLYNLRQTLDTVVRSMGVQLKLSD
jgi:hypothetical protein